MNKFSKRDMYEAIINYCNASSMSIVRDNEVIDISREDMLTFARHEIELLDSKNAKAKIYAEKKKNEADEVCDAIYNILGEEYMLASDIVIALDNEEITINKITSKLKKLVDAHLVEKAEQKIKVDGKTLTRMGYKRV